MVVRGVRRQGWQGGALQGGLGAMWRVCLTTAAGRAPCAVPACPCSAPHGCGRGHKAGRHAGRARVLAVVHGAPVPHGCWLLESGKMAVDCCVAGVCGCVVAKPARQCRCCSCLQCWLPPRRWWEGGPDMHAWRATSTVAAMPCVWQPLLASDCHVGMPCVYVVGLAFFSLHL